jgi:hypothetical protein
MGRLRARKTLALLFACLFMSRPERQAEIPRVTPLLVDDPAIIAELEESGFSFSEIVGSTRLAMIAATVERDVAELVQDASAASPRRPFQPHWFRRGHFELIGVVNRIDRAPFDPPGSKLCGEVRLVYRLALAPPGRPITRLPMTVNVRIPQPQGKGDTDCRHVARRWQSDSNIVGILRALPPFAEVEINFQLVHVPATRNDMDDNAEYVLRAFSADLSGLVPDTLFNTPRSDLTDPERLELARWIVQNLDAIDRGTAVVPEKFLATRAVSVSPRGLVHLTNRPFSQLFPDPRATFAGVTSDRRALVTTPELLVRRLDEGTCPGCHQSRGVAGFHLLGEERERGTSFNALAVGHSPHLTADLEWRARFLASVARGEQVPTRPFAGHPRGAYGDECGLVAGFLAWTCAPGFACRDLHHFDVGVCTPTSAGEPGDPCEDVQTRASMRPEGIVVSPFPPDPACAKPMTGMTAGPVCAPNWLGFTGGMCSELCSRIGEVKEGAICAPLPAVNYEKDCLVSREPIEECLRRHYISARIATCSPDRPCRDDYVCARVPGAVAGTGACIPPYFLFQIRVDGPLLDR